MWQMRTVFVDDNDSHRNTIRYLLNQCQDVELIGEADSLETAYSLIRTLHPQLVLLDVELYPGTAFDLLQRLQSEGPINFQIIFLTGFANFEYPIRAIHYAALDFLMKPVDQHKFFQAVGKALQKVSSNNYNDELQLQIAYLLQNLAADTEKKKIKLAFHRVGGAIDFVYAKEIVYCEADKDTTLVVLSDGRQFAATRNLSFYAKSMQLDFNFFRISDKQLVNLDFVQTYEHHKNYQLTLVNGVVLHASRRGGQDLRQYIASNYHSDNITTSAGSISPKVDSLSSLIKNFLK